ncbi:uncharacterized protein N7459_008654 [Penicillium hispanicum]|uniref:uncharacterized protein n=1 Tax=Penicillium hispanicum TaxID=1080232 RepID=UPI002541A72B|nr:uncharacterized protein N7459_008654 [Penicillium hispanicum]KAJ5574227.1 hypothetical protein N7459_008654 [Penicillium hispanicum]
MDLAIASAVFFTANIWGLYGGIPFTAIHPSNSFWDRTLGSFQLASTVYTLEQIQPDLISTKIEFFPESVPDTPASQALRDFLDSKNITIDSFPMASSATRIGHGSPSLASSPSLLLSGESQQSIPRLDRGVQQDKLHENIVLTFLVIILGAVMMQMMRQIDATRQIQNAIKDLSANIRMVMITAGQEIQDIVRDLTDDIQGGIHNLGGDIRADLRAHAVGVGGNIEGLRDVIRADIQNQGEDIRHVEDGIRINIQSLEDSNRTHFAALDDRLKQFVNDQTTTNQAISSFPQQLQQLHLGIERLCIFVNLLQSQRCRLAPGESMASHSDDDHSPHRRLNEVLKDLERTMNNITSNLQECLVRVLPSQKADTPIVAVLNETAGTQNQASESAGETMGNWEADITGNAGGSEEAESSKAAENETSDSNSPRSVTGGLEKASNEEHGDREAPK